MATFSSCNVVIDFRNVVIMSLGVMGPLAAGRGHSVTGQAADPPMSSFASQNKQHGYVFDGWAEPSSDWQRAGAHQAASHVQMPDVCVSATVLLVICLLTRT